MKLFYMRGYYGAAPEGKNTAIVAFTSDDKYSEQYCTVSICLAEYDMYPEENQIFIPAYKFTDDDVKQFINDLAKKVIKTVKIGPFDAECILIELKDDWKETVKEM